MHVRISLILRAIWELLVYDMVSATIGFRGIEQRMKRVRSRERRPELEAAVCDAMLSAIAFYWKPVPCLQFAVATARLLRMYCASEAQVVIGYRPSPFFSHAWVEIAGRTVNDAVGYQRQLQVLTRL